MKSLVILLLALTSCQTLIKDEPMIEQVMHDATQEYKESAVKPAKDDTNLNQVKTDTNLVQEAKFKPIPLEKAPELVEVKK
jgi:hypothetical protein